MVDHILKDVSRYGCVFLHCGSLYDPDDLRTNVLESARERGWLVHHITATDIPMSEPLEFDDDYLFLVDGFERLLASTRVCEGLSNLRATVQVLLEAGVRVVLLSRVPRLRLLGCVGSQLVIDAKPAFPQPFSMAQAAESDAGTEVVLPGGVSVGQASGGMPRLIRRIVELSEVDDFELLSSSAVSTEIYSALNEVGPEVVAWLEAAANLGVDRIGFEEIPPLVLEALRGAGLAASEDGWRSLAIFEGRVGNHLREAVRRYAEGSTDVPSQYPEVITDLWTIERLLRGWIGSTSRAKFEGNWKRHVCASPKHAERALRRAQVDAFPQVVHFEDLPSPVEWFTLGELMDLIDVQDWCRPFGIPLRQWRRFKQEVLPIRDRAAHMRLLQSGDGDRVRSWRRRLEQWATATESSASA